MVQSQECTKLSTILGIEVGFLGHGGLDDGVVCVGVVHAYLCLSVCILCVFVLYCIVVVVL